MINFIDIFIKGVFKSIVESLMCVIMFSYLFILLFVYFQFLTHRIISIIYVINFHIFLLTFPDNQLAG
jgi:hypothetical protein